LIFVERVHNQTPYMFDEKPSLLTPANIESATANKQKEIIDMIIRHMESDRREIANSLHEQINQVLATAKLMLENMPCVTEEMECYTKQISTIISKTLLELNKICNDINPDALRHVSLVSLVGDMLTRLAREKSIVVHFDGSGYRADLKRNPEHELTMLRIIQECIYKVLISSNATKLNIVLETLDYSMFLEMVCNDEMMDLNDLNQDIAIRNLYNRSVHFGGSFKIDRPTNREIVFCASIPNCRQQQVAVN
jgi:two-component system NarL family sensor kinase